MQPVAELQERRTSADDVFDYLRQQIATLELMPGTKISEAEIAAKFGVSRQPVRDAFSRLENLDLLLIRPQKATVVKWFSLKSIATARFARLAVELEVVRRALQLWDGSFEDAFEESLAAQSAAVKAQNVDEFHQLDYEFHRLLCHAAKSDFAFEIISTNKARIDRLCVLSLTSGDSMAVLVDDHEVILKQLKLQNEPAMLAGVRKHLARLDETVDAIYEEHKSYFSD